MAPNLRLNGARSVSSQPHSDVAKDVRQLMAVVYDSANFVPISSDTDMAPRGGV